MGGGLDGAAHRQQGPVRGRGRVHCVAGAAGARSAGEAADCVRCSGRGTDSGASCVLWRDAVQWSGAEDFERASDFADEGKWVAERRIRFSAGWGTFLTNDFRDCNPQGDEEFNPVSLVWKLTDVEGRPAVKLSDNYSKALGPEADVDRYRRVFGTEGVANLPVIA